MEEWKFINNSKIYQVSNMGRIRCVEYTIIRCDGKPYHIKLNKNKRGFQRQLAKEYGVSETTISEIKTGRKRKVS